MSAMQAEMQRACGQLVTGNRMDALWAALEVRFPKEAENTRASLQKILQTISPQL